MQFNSPKQEEAQRGDRSASHVVIDVTDGDVKQPANRGVVCGATISHCDGEHSRSTQDGVLVSTQTLDQRVCLLQAAVHRERDAECKTTKDFLVLCVLCVLQYTHMTSQKAFRSLLKHFANAYPDHILDGASRLRSEHNKTHGDTGRLSRHRVVLI